MNDFPRKLQKVLKFSDDQRLQFSSPLITIIPTLLMAVISSVPVLWMIMDQNNKVAVRALVGFIFFAPIPFLLINSIPRKLELNFDTKTYVATAGIGRFARRQTGRFDNISAVYVRGEINAKTNVPLYVLGLAFGGTPKKAPTFAMTLPVCDLVRMREKEQQGLWEYSKQLALRIQVPCIAIGWQAPET